MSERPRHVWQLHLSTTIVLTLGVGFLMLKNIPAQHFTGLSLAKSTYIRHTWRDEFVEHDGASYGWLCAYFRTILSKDFDPAGFSPSGLLIDALVGLGILLSIAIVLEWLIGRREARKP